MTDQKFTGTSTYVATDDLMMAVNAAVTLERPILIKGEPGTGKTQLAIGWPTRLAGHCTSGTSNQRLKHSKVFTSMTL